MEKDYCYKLKELDEFIDDDKKGEDWLGPFILLGEYLTFPGDVFNYLFSNGT